MTLSEYTLELSKKGLDVRYREVGAALKIIVEEKKKNYSVIPIGRSYSTMVYSSEMKTRSQKEYEQLIIDKIQKLINQKFTEPIDTTIKEIKE